MPHNGTAGSRTLIADDQPDVLKALRLLLRPQEPQISEVTTPAGILAELETREFNVLLMDLNCARDTTSGRERLDLLPRVCEPDTALPTVMMTAYGSIEVAVEAMRNGARDFVEKPQDNERLLAIMRTQAELAHTLRRTDPGYRWRAVSFDFNTRQSTFDT